MTNETTEQDRLGDIAHWVEVDGEVSHTDSLWLIAEVRKLRAERDQLAARLESERVAGDEMAALKLRVHTAESQVQRTRCQCDYHDGERPTDSCSA